MIKSILGTMLTTAVPSLLKLGIDRMQHSGSASPVAGPSGNTAGLAALYAGILQKINGLTAANAALETKLGFLAAAIVIFWGTVVGPVDSADHRAWVVVGAVLLGLALLMALGGMWTRPLRGSVVDFNDSKYDVYPSLEDQPLLRRLITHAEDSTRALHKANAFKASCFNNGIVFFTAGAIAVTIGLLKDSM